MKYENLNEINKELMTMDIKGKDYVEVNQRILGFKRLYENGSIETEIISNNDGVVIMKATVKDDNGKILSTGHAYEKENSTFINKTSYIENCETSAVGRALGILGIGINTSIASAEEVLNAQKQQQKPTDDLITYNQTQELFKIVGKETENRQLIKNIMAEYGYVSSGEIKHVDLPKIIE